MQSDGRSRTAVPGAIGEYPQPNQVAIQQRSAPVGRIIIRNRSPRRLLHLPGRSGVEITYSSVAQFQGRSAGSAHCRTENQALPVQRAYGRSDTSCERECGSASRCETASAFSGAGRQTSSPDQIVIVRFGDPKPADLPGRGFALANR